MTLESKRASPERYLNEESEGAVINQSLRESGECAMRETSEAQFRSPAVRGNIDTKEIQILENNDPDKTLNWDLRSPGTGADCHDEQATDSRPPSSCEEA